VIRNIDIANETRRTAILIAALAIVAVTGSTAEPTTSNVTGVVKNASGQPVAGAFVKVASADSGRLTYMVVSQDKGRYSSPSLPPGKYMVQGFGGGYQSASAAPVEVASGQPGKMDLDLSVPQKTYPPPKKFTDEEYVKLMPEGEGKKILLTKCVICHSPGNYVARRATRDRWEASVDSMRLYLEENPERRAEYNARTGLNVVPLTDHERDVIVDYVSKNFGPDTPPIIEPPPADPNRHLPRTFLKGAETKYFAMELSLGDSIQAGNYVVDPQGIIWVCEKTTGILGRLDPKTLAYTRVVTPSGKPNKDIFGAVALDPKGNVWFTSLDGPHSQWIEYDPKTQKVINTYDVPIAPIPGGDIFYNTLRFPADGSVWATSTAKQRMVKLDPNTRKVTEYPVRMGQHPFGLTVGGDGMVWFSGDEDNTIVRVDTATGKFTAYPLPTPKSRPRRIVADADGNLWANTLSEGKLVKVDYRTGNITEYTPPTKGAGQGVDVDKKRNVIWYGEYENIRIGRFDPRTNTFAEYPLTSTNEQPWIIQLDPSNTNRVWWNSRNGKLGYIQLTD